jgi:tRNA/tmRNA/rRNA uracil-C5-methylase (TrmA/RlmC/RlmD family)
MIRRVTIERLAPTGEGVARTADGVGFVSGALPGEEVDAEVTETKKRFWFGRAVSVLSPSPMRETGPHAGCAGCDWAHLTPSAGSDAKPRLFAETMERIGELDPTSFEGLSIVPSPTAYRLRSRFHVSGRGAEALVGFHAPGSHVVLPADRCEALTAPMREALASIREAVASSGVAVAEIATLETLDGSRRVGSVLLNEDPPAFGASRLAASLEGVFEGVSIRVRGGGMFGKRGQTRLPIQVEGRSFDVSVGSFFQGNRHLAGRLYADVREAAGEAAPARALDAYGGVGFLAGALLDRGHSVVSVEASERAAADAARNRKAWGVADRWEIAALAVDAFLDRDDTPFEVLVADPPRAGLGLALAPRLAAKARRTLVYLSCEPATLARDLPLLLGEGFAIRSVRLYDLFVLTHRVEAMVVLDRQTAA